MRQILFLVAAVDGITTNPDEIMERRMHRLKLFKERIDKRSQAAVDDFQRASEQFSGPQLFEEGKRIMDRVIAEDDPANQI
jgi:hypothetical protein